ncbi:MAG TPA: hypothetical protein VM621_16490 [Luteibacter sp.]|uniref:hypothetical protein n=1 Tax=Luteibacter sp. TaxID=1886636 RepID=UPI002C414503|nr:hypothetical protein [Luteibacter sp.]HVI56641.1 hypothetical protein [Luteibacter sp.]
MKNTIITAALVACLLGLSCPALARNGDPAPKGWLLVRSGAANTDANYDKEDSDSNGKLHGVSVLCAGISDTPAKVQQLIATDGTRVWGPNRGVAQASTAINLGGNVVLDALPNNPNHCLINGLTVSKIKGIWH